ncbi:MAG: hypothetical protein JNM48_07465 [Rhodospirillales bacterium]|nr:hypothetical protein [Rhodospirillales bacterium]
MIRLLPASMAFAATIAPGLAVADVTGQATLNAVSFQPLPASQPIEVRVLDNSDENLAIMRALEAALKRLGTPLAGGDAPLLLTIDTGDSVGAWNAPPGSDRVPMMDDRGRLFPQGELDIARQARLPVSGTTVVTPPQYRLGLILDARSTGARLWQGWAIAPLSDGEPSELAAAMVPKLAASIGETVREEVFDLQQ